MTNPLTYQYTIDPHNDKTTAGRILRLVGRNKRVLELGCAVGSMSSALVTNNACSVTGVEIDPAAAELARPYLSRLIVGDLDALSWVDNFAEDRFEVIVAADVLEHLRDPWLCMRNIALHLQQTGGRVVTSLPNIGHLSVLAGLLRGEFSYSQTGILDRTHVRFFTPRGVAEMLAKSGLRIDACEFVQAGPEHPEVRRHWSHIGRLNRYLLTRQREATIYQSVFACSTDEHITVEANLDIVNVVLGGL